MTVIVTPAKLPAMNGIIHDAKLFSFSASLLLSYAENVTLFMRETARMGGMMPRNKPWIPSVLIVWRRQSEVFLKL